MISNKNKNPFIISNDICEYNARQKLNKFIKNTDILPFKSTNWNYDLDINHFLKKQNEEFEILLNNVNKKEKEIIQTEKLFLKNSIFSKGYKPLFIKNLSEEEKKEFNQILEDKIKNIKYSIRKKNILNCQNDSIRNIENKIL